MTDEEIRELLAAFPHRSMLKHPPGTVAILQQDIRDSGANVEEVERWITTHAGNLAIAPAVQSKRLRPGRRVERSYGPTPYYVVATQVLET